MTSSWGAVLAAIGAAATAWAGPAGQEPGEPACMVSVLRNGDFAEAPDPDVGGAPWWTPLGAGGEVVDVEGRPELLLRGDAAGVVQPVAVYAPWIGRVVLRGQVRGRGSLTVYCGGTATHEFDGDPARLQDFEVVMAEATQLQGKLRPRLRVQLSGESDFGAPASSWWSALEVLAPLPCPSEPALREEVFGLFSAYVDEVLARALDDVGERATPFVAFDFDAETGARIEGSLRRRVGDVGFHDLLLRAWRARPEPAWEAALQEFLDAYLTLCLHPDTGLECRWDPRADVRTADEPVEVHRGLGFLLDVAEHGPASHRSRALAAAERMARTILAHGVLPDGEVAARYRPSDGVPFFDVPHLRRLDVPAQLARVASRTADAQLGGSLLRAAEEACLTLAYDHYWPGDWANVDPGFDDNFGHYGERATTMWEAHPESGVFRALALSGFRRYAPLWRNALRYGGNVAADQVRCWKIFARIARLEPDERSAVAELLHAAAHSHFKGEQLASGAWIDTTVKRFHPVQLPVGDIGGVPQNLLEGLAALYGERELGLRGEELRSMYVAVLRATVDGFRRPFGFVGGRAAAPGRSQPAYAGSTRLAIGLVEMMEALRP
ncbi:MAG: hypothetical protein AAF682_25265 [Planctomycetota bacterium]